jgi:hypothetical protein
MVPKTSTAYSGTITLGYSSLKGRGNPKDVKTFALCHGCWIAAGGRRGFRWLVKTFKEQWA